MSNVTVMPGLTTLDVPVRRVLEGAPAADLKQAIVLGYDKDGKLYFASSTGDVGGILLLLEQTKLGILNS